MGHTPHRCHFQRSLFPCPPPCPMAACGGGDDCRQHLRRYAHQCAGMGGRHRYDLSANVYGLHFGLCGRGFSPSSALLSSESHQHLCLSWATIRTHRPPHRCPLFSSEQTHGRSSTSLFGHPCAAHLRGGSARHSPPAHDCRLSSADMGIHPAFGTSRTTLHRCVPNPHAPSCAGRYHRCYAPCPPDFSCRSVAHHHRQPYESRF